MIPPPDDRSDSVVVGARSLAGRLVVAAAVTAATGLALSLVVRIDALSAIDDDATAAMHRWAIDHRVVERMARGVTVVGNPTTLWIVVVAVAAWLIGHRRVATAIWVVATTACGSLVEIALKVVVGRSRPDLDSVFLDPTSRSFPSGHAFNTTVVFGVVTVALVVMATGVDDRAVPAAVAGAALVAAAVGLTRPVLGVHFVSDVLAGWVLGIVWLVAARPQRSDAAPIRSGPGPASG